MINTDEYFTEITDESKGTIGYHCHKTQELVSKIAAQNKELQELKQANEELENLLEFFTVDECEMNRAMVKMKNQLKEIKALAEAGMKRFDYSYPDCTELQQIIKITERKANKNANF